MKRPSEAQVHCVLKEMIAVIKQHRDNAEVAKVLESPEVSYGAAMRTGRILQLQEWSRGDNARGIQGLHVSVSKIWT